MPKEIEYTQQIEWLNGRPYIKRYYWEVDGKKHTACFVDGDLALIKRRQKRIL